MKENFEQKLESRVGRDPGFRVPEGYFDSLSAQVMAKLPEQPKRLADAPISKWTRLKPYIYMAAMFAGIWCMMKMFHTMMTAPEISLENPPASIARVMDDYNTVTATDYYHSDGPLMDMELLSDLSGEYASLEDFVRDFQNQ